MKYAQIQTPYLNVYLFDLPLIRSGQYFPGFQQPVFEQSFKNLDEAAILRKIRIVQQEGKLSVRSEVDRYNLDAVLVVGYRVSSHKGTQFRRWATRVLRDHLRQGYTLNRHRFEQNADALRQALNLMDKSAQSPELTREA